VPANLNALCEVWDATLPTPPVHSRLFHLEPIGVGTPRVESLTSYLMRLAEAHSVHLYTLIYKEIAPLLERPSIYRNGILVGPFGDRSAALNGYMPTTRLLVQVVERLTARRELRWLTMLTFADVLSQRNLVRRTQAWCPHCYEEWQGAGQPLYTPLLWALACITYCPWHGTPLSVCCPYPDCARPVSPLNLQGTLGFCSRCQRWLGSSAAAPEEGVIPSSDQTWQQWVAATVGDLLATAATCSVPPTQATFAASLTALVNDLAEGSIARLAEQIGSSLMTLYGWRSGQRSLQLDLLIYFSAQVGCPPLAILQGTARATREQPKPDLTGPVPSPARVRQPRKQRDRDETRQALEAIVERNEQPPRSLRATAREFGYHAANLARLFPEPCQVIADRYRAYLTNKRAEGCKRRCEEARQAVRRLLEQGKYPSKRQTELLLNKPALFREAAVKAAWLEALQEAGLTG
jgi:AraC-like DNA-binding protein